MKICRKCGEEQEREKFSLNRSKKDGLNSYCKACHKVNRKEHYEKHKQKYVKKSKDRREEILRYVFNYLCTKKCCNCEFSNPLALDFHHLTDKSYGISIMAMNGMSIKGIQAEIEKCVVMCSNCHRIETAISLGRKKSVWRKEMQT